MIMQFRALIVCALLYSGSLLANYQPCLCCPREFFISMGWGYSWSPKIDLDVDTNVWDPAVQGYNGNIGNTELYSVGFGYHFCPLFSLALEFDYRPKFKYKKFQTSTASTTPGFIGTTTRFFRLSNWSYTLNLYLNKQGRFWACNYWCDRSVAPFLGAGLGVSYNTVHDFHSVSPIPAGASFAPVHSIMQARTATSFTGQVMAGLVSYLTERLSAELGYRRFYGGRFFTNNYVVDVPSGFTSPIQVPAWRGHLHANEVYLSLNYAL
ncbi:MAG TPA: hypothetical protein VIH61_08705 [Waddliaceae bacterium]